MRSGIYIALLTGMTLQAVERPLGRLADGQLYVLDEVDFCLTAEAAARWSPPGAIRPQAASPALDTLHPAIRRVVGNHLCADNWLHNRPLPSTVQRTGNEVPAIARSLTALLDPGTDAADVVEDLRLHPDIEWASLNVLHPVSHEPNDPRWTNQWGALRINATNAWDLTQVTTGLRVAVVDTGVDLGHPDLASRIVYNRGFGGNANGDAMRDVRGNSSIDHGTHVAGIAAAIRDNNLGIAGVANAGIMAMGCAVWDGTNAYNVGSGAAAINDAIANGAFVINCSFGQRAPLSDSMRSALDNAETNGVLVICAAGNDGTNILNSPSAAWAAHGWPIIVSNIQQDDSLNPGSNYGNDIDLAAPGTAILSAFTTNYTAAAADGSYGDMTGTSQASPHVAGAAILVRATNPLRINAAATRDLLFRMAEDLGAPGKDSTNGFGMLQVPASFLSVLKAAHTFAGLNSGAWVPNGSYALPFASLPDAIAATPSGGTIVLNGGIGGITRNYPAQDFNMPITLTALPDRPVTIGN